MRWQRISQIRRVAHIHAAFAVVASPGAFTAAHLRWDAVPAPALPPPCAPLHALCPAVHPVRMLLHSLLATGYCLMVANYLNFHFNFELSRLSRLSVWLSPLSRVSHFPCESRLFSLPDSFSSFSSHSTVPFNELSLRSVSNPALFWQIT